MKTWRRKTVLGTALLLGFVLWTWAVCRVDVQPIGPRHSQVGFAAFNGWVHSLTGVHFTLYHITDWLGLVPVSVCFGFALLGLYQWIRRKKLFCVDGDILLLGVFYLAVMAAYLYFESHVINRRPVLISGYLEASYPSSTTLLVLCVMPALRMQLLFRMRESAARRALCTAVTAFTVFMTLGRLISGVHWASDIIGGALLSGGLVTLYDGACCAWDRRWRLQ